MKQFKYYLIIFIIAIAQNAYGQKSPIKFGKVSSKDLEMSACDFFPDADAMVLGETGDISITWDEDHGLAFMLKIHRRIKIFNKNGKDEANVKIPYYYSKDKRNRESVGSLKGFTYTLEDGNVVKTKLEKTDQFTNKTSKYREERSFTMPNVQDGCIIEYKYTLVSPFIGELKTWYFQDLIPTKYSRVSLSAPDFFDYSVIQLGNAISPEVEDGFTSGVLSSQTADFAYKIITARNILPLTSEPFMEEERAVLSRIEFNLVRLVPKTNFDFIQDYGSNYTQLNENLLHSFHFGARLSKGSFAKDWTNILEGKSEMEKTEFILKRIQENMIWNNAYAYKSETAGTLAFGLKTGNSADINLTLVAALRQHGLKANAAILNLRRYGIPHPVYPRKSGFSYVIAVVEIDGKQYFCDGTMNVPVGFLRKECINNKAWVVDKVGHWVDLTKHALWKEIEVCKAEIKEDEVIANIALKFKQYAGLYTYNKYQGDMDKFKEKIEKMLPDWEIEDVSFDENNTKEIFQINIKAKKEIDDPNLILIKPFLYGSYEKNPFKREKRDSNIDFVYKNIYSTTYTLQVPEGYSVELPKSIRMQTEDASIKFSYFATQQGQKISLSNKTIFKRSVFSPAEYEILKQFFQAMEESNAQMIVLKKNN